MSGLLSETLVFAISIPIAYLAARNLGLQSRLAAALFGWHTAACLVYWQYAQSNPADANAYYRYGTYGDTRWVPGTAFVRSVSVVLAQDLQLSYLASFFLFNVIGLIGLYYLAATTSELREDLQGRVHALAGWIPFLPLLSFWSSALGKDAFAFLGVTMAAHASLQFDKRWRSMVLGGAFLFLVRPHMTGMMLAALLVASALGGKISVARRMVGLVLSAAVSAVLLPFVFSYVGLGEVNASGTGADDYEDAVMAYVEKRQGYNLEGGSSVEISQMALPMQLFSFMFRPLFFDAPGAFGLLVSLDNAALLFAFLFSGAALVRTLRQHSFAVRFNLVYVLSGWLALASVTANMGIAVRQKTMILPSLFVLLLVAHGRSGSGAALPVLIDDVSKK